MLSSKLNVLSHNSIPSGQIWKIPSQTGVAFFEDNHFEYQQPYVNFKIEHSVPLLHSKWSDLENSFTNKVCFFFFFKTMILSPSSVPSGQN